MMPPMMPMGGAGGPPPGKKPVTIDAVMALLKDGALRRFRVDIETDSTIVGDESQERRDRNEFILSVTQFVQGWGPLITANPKLARMAGDLLMFGVRAYRVGRELEETIEDTVEQIDQIAQQPPSPPPQMMIEQAKLEGTKAKTQAEIQKAMIGAKQAQIEGQAKIAQTVLQHHTSMREAAMNEAVANNEMMRDQAAAAREAMSQPMPPGVMVNGQS